MDNLKTYIAEVVARKVIPSALASAVAALGTYLIAHTEILAQYGITFWHGFSGVFPASQAPTGDILVIEFDTLEKGVALLAITGIGAAMAFLTHHTEATVTGAPQNGDKRVNAPMTVTGGQRQGDPK